MKKIIFYAFLLVPVCVFSQTYQPAYKTTFTIQNDSNQILNDYQVLIIFNTASSIAAGHMQVNGEDLRFTADSCSPVSYFDYWIEDGINTDSTRIWVKIPLLLSNSSTNFLLWYGDPLAGSYTNFTNTFPTSFISSGNDTLFTGTIFTDWFQLDTGDVINLVSDSPIEIRSRVIILDGKIQGRGMGFSAPIAVANGNGPGGGGLSTEAGGGGGSYAGIGGMGGYDLGDTPGNGGAIYGAENDFTCPMGSSGGTTDNAIGGAGGASIKLSAEWISIGGQIDAGGSQGVGSIGRCGGGGSGGTIMAIGDNINIGSSAVLQSLGGDGGSGSSAANDGGGGGSGGRIKIFHGTTWNSSGSFSLLGGNGGLYGSEAFGEDGALGTYFDSTITFPLVFLSNMGPETALQAEIIGLDSVYCLNKDSVTLEAVPIGGTFGGPGVTGNYFFPLVAGVGIHSITYAYTDPTGCGNLYDTVIVEVLNIPVSPMASNNGPLCEGATLTLAASDSLAGHLWSGPNGFTCIGQFPIIPAITELNDGAYTVIITNAAGCTSSASTSLTVYPTPDVTVSNNAPVCIDEDVIFIATGGLSYNWNGPNGFSSAAQSPTLADAQFPAMGIYTVTITGTGGCITTVTSEVIIDGCYDNIDEDNNEEIIVFPNPTHGQLWIELADQNFEDDVYVALYDISGKLLFFTQQLTDNGRPSIDLSNLASGVYMLAIRENHRIKTFKVVKN